MKSTPLHMIRYVRYRGTAISIMTLVGTKPILRSLSSELIEVLPGSVGNGVAAVLVQATTSPD